MFNMSNVSCVSRGDAPAEEYFMKLFFTLFILNYIFNRLKPKTCNPSV